VIVIIKFFYSGLGRIPKDLLKNVTKIGLCGQMHGVMLWNPDSAWIHAQSSPSSDRKTSERYELGKGPISPLYTWQDARCSAEFLEALPKPDSHLRLATGYGCCTLLWKLKNESEESLSQFACAGTIQDFFVAMMCEMEKPVMSIQNAASWGYFNTQTKEWNIDILKTVNFPVNLLPNVVDSGTVVGHLSKNWCGIPRGVDVLAALGDMQCSVLSIAADEQDRTAVLNISTSAQLSFPMPLDFTPPSTVSAIQYFPYFDNRYVAVAASLNGGNAMASFVRMIQSWMQDLGFGVPQSLIWDKMLSLAKHTESSEREMNIVPTLFGERHLSSLPAAHVSNITQHNISLGNVAKSLFSGLIVNLHK